MNTLKTSVQNKKEKDEFFGVAEKFEKCFFQNRINFLTGEITEENVGKIIQWIIYENTTDETPKTLTLYINSEGGDLYQAFALIDMMNASKHTIRTIGVGNIMSAAFLIFASGTKKERYISKNTGSMCHQYSGEIEGKHHDIIARMKESELCNKRMLCILQEATGLESRVIKSKLLNSTDVWLDSEEMVSFGLADHIL